MQANTKTKTRNPVLKTRLGSTVKFENWTQSKTQCMFLIYFIHPSIHRSWDHLRCSKLKLVTRGGNMFGTSYFSYMSSKSKTLYRCSIWPQDEWNDNHLNGMMNKWLQCTLHDNLSLKASWFCTRLYTQKVMVIVVEKWECQSSSSALICHLNTTMKWLSDCPFL